MVALLHQQADHTVYLMRKPTPKTYRKIKRRPIVLEPGVRFSGESDTIIIGRSSRVNKLPPYKEYNPKRVHVARRRRAYKEHKTFPRGWTMIEEQGESHIGQGAIDAIVNGGWTTTTKVAADEWSICGEDIT